MSKLLTIGGGGQFGSKGEKQRDCKGRTIRKLMGGGGGGGGRSTKQLFEQVKIK